MFLYYDRVAKVFTLDLGPDEDPVFLGPITNALVFLRRKYKLTDSQAREATLQAIFNMGDAVDIETIKKIASSESKFFQRNDAVQAQL
jgi:hypothetical protein